MALICRPYSALVTVQSYILLLRCLTVYNILNGMLCVAISLWISVAAIQTDSVLTGPSDAAIAGAVLLNFNAFISILSKNVSNVFLDVIGSVASIACVSIVEHYDVFLDSGRSVNDGEVIVTVLSRVMVYALLAAGIEYLVLCRQSEALRQYRFVRIVNSAQVLPHVASHQSIEAMFRQKRHENFNDLEDEETSTRTVTMIAKGAIVFIFRTCILLFALLPDVLFAVFLFSRLSDRVAFLISISITVSAAATAMWFVIHFRVRILLAAPFTKIATMVEQLTTNQTKGATAAWRRSSLESPQTIRTSSLDMRDMREAGNRAIKSCLSKLSGCCRRKHHKKADMPYEAVLLHRYMRRLWKLVRVGLGEAGHAVVAKYLQRSSALSRRQSGHGSNMLDPQHRGVLRGEKVHAIFMFCDIRSFTDITEVLQEEVLSFVNEVAAVVHTEVDASNGVPNKNIGDAFLLTWKLPDAPLGNIVKTRRRSNSNIEMNAPERKRLGTHTVNTRGSKAGLSSWFASSMRHSDVTDNGASAYDLRSPTTGVGTKSKRVSAPHLKSVASRFHGMIDHRRGSSPNMRRSSDAIAVDVYSVDGEEVGAKWVQPFRSSKHIDTGDQNTGIASATEPANPHSVPQVPLTPYENQLAPIPGYVSASKPSSPVEVVASPDFLENSPALSPWNTVAGQGYLVDAKPDKLQSPSSDNDDEDGMGAMPSFMDAKSPISPSHSMANMSSSTMMRRNSSRFLNAASANATNPYRQRRGIQVLANNALAAALNTLAKIAVANEPYGRLYYYRGKFPELINFRLGFGLHLGYAVEGPIGTHLKVDASYLSPAVNITARLESATRMYGVDLIVSQKFAECLSEKAQNLLRLIDRVKLKGVADPLAVYTFDWDPAAAIRICNERAAEDSKRDGHKPQAARTGTADSDDSILDMLASSDALGSGTFSQRDAVDLGHSGSVATRSIGSGVSNFDYAATQAVHTGRAIRYTAVAGKHNHHHHKHHHQQQQDKDYSGEKTVQDMADIQPEALLNSRFFEHSELAIMFYLGGMDTPLDWGRARHHAEEALRIRPSDGPLLAVLQFMDKEGVGPEKMAPNSWPGFRSLDQK